MKFMAMNKCHGDMHNNRQVSLAVLRSWSLSTRRDASRTLMPANNGLTSQGTPNHAPIASVSAQPGGTGEYQRFASYDIRSRLKASGTGGAGIVNSPWAK